MPCRKYGGMSLPLLQRRAANRKALMGMGVRRRRRTRGGFIPEVLLGALGAYGAKKLYDRFKKK